MAESKSLDIYIYGLVQKNIISATNDGQNNITIEINSISNTAHGYSGKTTLSNIAVGGIGVTITYKDKIIPIAKYAFTNVISDLTDNDSIDGILRIQPESSSLYLYMGGEVPTCLN